MPEDSEILNPDDAPAVAAEYVKPYQDRWVAILKTQMASTLPPEQRREIAALISELIGELEYWRGDHYAVSAQALDVTSRLMKEAGMTGGH